MGLAHVQVARDDVVAWIATGLMCPRLSSLQIS